MPCYEAVWHNEIVLGTVGAGEAGTSCTRVTQHCVKLEMSAIFFFCALSKDSLARVQHPFSWESEVCTTSSLLCRPTLSVSGAREGMKVSRVLDVSGDCLVQLLCHCLGFLERFHPREYFSWPQDKTSKNMSQDQALWHCVPLTPLLLASLWHAGSCLLVEQRAMRHGPHFLGMD